MFKKASLFSVFVGLALALTTTACTDDGTSDTTDGTTSGDGDGDATTSGDGDGDATSGDGDGDGGGAGVCGLTCETPADCDQGAGLDWTCDGGFCGFEPPACDPNAAGDAFDFTDCFGQPSNCVPVGGVNTCVQGVDCADDAACEAIIPGFVCTGTDDDAGTYCEPAPFTCTPDEACEGGYGVCNAAGDSCVCASDDDCTADGIACNMS